MSKSLKPFETFTEVIPVTYRYLTLDGKKLNFTKVYEIVEELEETDGYFSNMVIYDRDIADALESNGVISRNVRGSYHKGKNYKSFKERLELTDRALSNVPS